MNPSNGKAGALASAGPIPKNDPTEVLVGDLDGIKDVEPDRRWRSPTASLVGRG
jgi:hypothetical protein